MRSIRRAWVLLLFPAVLLFALQLTVFSPDAFAADLDPDCPVYRGEAVPAGFAGCAELEARVGDMASFATSDGFRLDRYEAVLDEFLRKLCHRNPETGWVRDKRVRDTGPYLGTLAGGELRELSLPLGRSGDILRIWTPPSWIASSSRSRPV